MNRRIVPIVEGEGEVEAIPILLRRLFSTFRRLDLLDQIYPPQRKKRHLIVKPNQLEKEIIRASRFQGCEAIIVLIDSDTDCAAKLAQNLVERALKERNDKHIEVILAVSEYESWLIGGASSIAGKRGLPLDLLPDEDPEMIPNAKAWLDKKMGSRKYLETDDQPALTNDFNICGAYRRCPSFRRFCKAIKRIAKILPPSVDICP
ncbi:MAG: DUF4276 family protein [bacterium]|nr:DUF4276 family protein [bacterium]